VFVSCFSGVAGGIGNPEARYVLTKNTEQWNIIDELAPAVGEVKKQLFVGCCNRLVIRLVVWCIRSC
jgi:hypothetical protein